MAELAPMPPAEGEGEKGKPQPRRHSWPARRELVTQMRLAGASFPEIGRTLGISKQRAEQIWKQFGPAPLPIPEEARRMLVARHEQIVRAHWNKREVPKHAEVIMAASRSIADLTGANAPLLVEERVDVVHRFDFSKVPADELDRLRAALLKARVEPKALPVASDAVVEVERPAKPNGAPGRNGHG